MSINNENVYNSHLQQNVGEYYKARVDQIEDEPDLYRLDIRGAGEAPGHVEVDWGQHHHAGDVDSKDNLISIFHCDKICSLVDNID